jgi:endonuclease/exonuclease/phosphatase family metal-dependent hydrolase
VQGPSLFLEHESSLSQLNSALPTKNQTHLRIVTFNIHYFQDTTHRDNTERVFQIVQQINADVVVLEEMPYTLNAPVSAVYDAQFATLGYNYVVRCNGEPFYEIGNVMYSKLPITDPVSRKLQTRNRCIVSGVVDTSFGHVRIIGTHLEVKSASSREREIKDILQFSHSTSQELQVIVGDFNCLESDVVFQYTKDAGFVNSFEAVGWERPNYTCWTGTTIDFILVSRALARHVDGAYVYHSTASDHLPIIVDLKP